MPARLTRLWRSSSRISPAVVVEGEIGDIGSGSEIHVDGPSADRALTTPEEARQFVPYKILPSAVAAVHDVASTRPRLFAGQN
jgi:fructose-bisphosphate aldolase class II